MAPPSDGAKANLPRKPRLDRDERYLDCKTLRLLLARLLPSAKAIPDLVGPVCTRRGRRSDFRALVNWRILERRDP